jgi:membrane protease YdiL (CAAX protease family)
METPRNKIAIAAAGFVIGMLLLVSVGWTLQDKLGMVGLVLSELMILAIALVSTLAARLDFRQVFRFRRSSGMEWLGSFLIYLSAFFGSAAVSYLMTALLPDMMTESSELMGGFILSGGLAFALIAVSVLPGICEEAWHRGYLLSSLGSIRSVAARVAIMGIVFGLFHLDPTRFFQTVLLGCALSFMRIKTDNLLVPMAIHCLNNLFSTCLLFFLSYVASLLPEQEMEAALEASGGAPDPALIAFLVLGACALSVLFLTLGRVVFKRVEARRSPGIPLMPLPRP